MTTPTLVVTGASGYVGGHVVAAARKAGWRVVSAVRQADGTDGAVIAYDLGRAPDPAAFPAGAPILHLAAVTREDADPSAEISAARALLDVARRRATYVVFVSSQVARADAPTAYGRTKHAIEADVLAAGGIVVRPGLVHGGTPGGVYGMLVRAARSAPLWPAVVPSPLVQPVHVAELAEALLRLLAAPERWRGRVVHVGAVEPVPFTTFMQAIARAHGRRLPTFPVPARLVLVGAFACERLGRQALAARARSLVAIPPMATADDLAALRVVVRPPLASYADRASRRARVAESAALLRYVLGAPAGVALIRRHARAVATLRDGVSLGLPRAFICWPTLLRVLDQPRARRGRDEFRWRLTAAAMIAEASPAGASRFLAMPANGTRAARVTSALVALVLDAVARVAGLLLARSRIAVR